METIKEQELEHIPPIKEMDEVLEEEKNRK